jgi:hypothetical protein
MNRVSAHHLKKTITTSLSDQPETRDVILSDVAQFSKTKQMDIDDLVAGLKALTMDTSCVPLPEGQCQTHDPKKGLCPLRNALQLLERHQRGIGKALVFSSQK